MGRRMSSRDGRRPMSAGRRPAGAPAASRGRALIAATALVVGIALLVLDVSSSAATDSSPQVASTAQVLKLVAAAPKIMTLPRNLTPSPQNAETDAVSLPGCQPNYNQVTVGRCVFGDTTAKRTIALLGDSHAGMWFPVVDAIAIRTHWRLVLFEKSACPAPDTSFWNPDGNVPYPQCDQWHSYAIARIKKLHPSVLIVTSADYQPADSSDRPISDAQWTAALAKTLTLAGSPSTKEVVIGDIPYLAQVDADCITAHASDVPACSTPATQAVLANAQQATRQAAQDVGALFVNVIPWICSAVCTPIIGNMLVYENQYHITKTYATYLGGALQSALAPLLASSTTTAS